MRAAITSNASFPHIEKPILVTDCAREVRALGAVVWLLEKKEFGFVMRGEIGLRQFRLVIPPPSAKVPIDVSSESNSALHVVRDMPRLRAFLHSLSA